MANTAAVPAYVRTGAYWWVMVALDVVVGSLIAYKGIQRSDSLLLVLALLLFFNAIVHWRKIGRSGR